MTFKAKLIEHKRFYTYRRNYMLLQIATLFLFGLTIQIFELPTWLSIVLLIVYVLVVAIGYYYLRRIQKLTDRHTIAMDTDSIKILAKSGDVSEHLDLSKIEGITYSAQYLENNVSVRDSWQEMTGTQQRNYLSIRLGGETHSYDFVPESSYMLVQLEKLMEHFRANGVAVQDEQAVMSD